MFLLACSELDYRVAIRSAMLPSTRWWICSTTIFTRRTDQKIPRRPRPNWDLTQLRHSPARGHPPDQRAAPFSFHSGVLFSAPRSFVPPGRRSSTPNLTPQVRIASQFRALLLSIITRNLAMCKPRASKRTPLRTEVTCANV